jgi:hypothetical protein
MFPEARFVKMYLFAIEVSEEVGYTPTAPKGVNVADL